MPRGGGVTAVWWKQPLSSWLELSLFLLTLFQGQRGSSPYHVSYIFLPMSSNFMVFTCELFTFLHITIMVSILTSSPGSPGFPCSWKNKEETRWTGCTQQVQDGTCNPWPCCAGRTHCDRGFKAPILGL